MYHPPSRGMADYLVLTDTGWAEWALYIISGWGWGDGVFVQLIMSILKSSIGQHRRFVRTDSEVRVATLGDRHRTTDP